MTNSTTPSPDPHLLLRRLHSLTGVFPIGLFLFFHLTTNSSILWGLLNASKHDTDTHAGVATFQHEVDFIHSTPALLLIEVFGLWLPIAFHAIYGAYIASTARPNTNRYRYGGNWRYSFQRITAWVGLIFIFYHVATLRWGWTFLVPGGTKWSADHAASTLAAALQGGTEGFTTAGIIVSAAYMVGVSMLVFHLANGLWTAAITWGLTTTETAMKRWGFVCAGLGVLLMAAAWSAVIGFATLDYDRARLAEQALHDEQRAADQEQLVNLPQTFHSNTYPDLTPEPVEFNGLQLEMIRDNALEEAAIQ